jgi:hypothetical protein
LGMKANAARCEALVWSLAIVFRRSIVVHMPKSHRG